MISVRSAHVEEGSKKIFPQYGKYKIKQVSVPRAFGCHLARKMEMQLYNA